MLCVTGFERRPESWRQRAERAPDAMHELRLDAFDDPRDALASLGQLPADTIVCCRARRQGGHSDAHDSDRVTLLRAALAQGARWIDIEGDVAPTLLAALPPERTLLSWHDFERGDAAAVSAALKRVRGRSDAYKVAVTIGDAADLNALVDVAPSGVAVLLGMGAAGMLSRCRYGHFGSAWSYVAADADQHTAAGQLTLAQARALGLGTGGRDDRNEWPLLALLGGDQVMHSPGPRVYGQLLGQLTRPYQYLPVVTTRLVDTLALLRRVGGCGASVTMPLKRAALEAGMADALALQVGAANTLAWRDDGWHAYNSDVVGVEAPLRAALAGLTATPRRALVLGAGGAAAAAVVALKRLGIHVTVAARKPKQAEALCPDAVETFANRATVAHNVLVNATALGGSHSPWQGPLHAAVVFDMSLEQPSQLIQQATAAGAHTIDGYAMWCAQGAAQMAHLIGIQLDAAQLARALDETRAPQHRQPREHSD